MDLLLLLKFPLLEIKAYKARQTYEIVFRERINNLNLVIKQARCEKKENELSMEILTSSLFPEVNCSFSISYKIDLEIRKALNEHIKPEMKLTSREEGVEYINLIISTNTRTYKMEVKGPDVNRKEKIINWGLWLPYREIVDSTTQEVPYLHFYFEALVSLFREYGIREERIRFVQEEVSNKVLGKSEYGYKNDSIEFDFSEFDSK